VGPPAVLSLILLLTVFAAPARTTGTEQRIHRVESGLVEFTSPAAMFSPDSAKLRDRKTLADRMRAYKVPGVGIAVVQDGRLAWARSYGVVDVRTGVPVGDATLFEAASASKLVTAAIVLQQVDAGVLDLDTDINRYLRSWKVPAGDSAWNARVTLRLLLSHQAGINRPDGGFPRQAGGTPTLLQVLEGAPPATNAPATIERAPGTGWQYSNMGYVVVQQVLEDVLGRPFPEIARAAVFAPLGLPRSTFVRPLPTGAVEVAPHDAEGVAHEPVADPGAVAHGGLMTTPSELARFAAELMRAHGGRSSRLLSRGMAARLFTPAVELDPKMFGLAMSDGLGAFLYRGGRELVFLHPGANEPGANCWVIGCPATGQAAVVMTNGAQGEVLAMEILTAIMREYAWPVGP
jgi:CubicO group peptidase (beta-lactamase class C family)